MIKVGRYYIEEYDIDGHRIDHAIGIDRSFMRKFRDEIHKEKENFFIFGECFIGLNELIDYNTYKTLWMIYRGKSWYLTNKLKLALSLNKERYIQNIRLRIYEGLTQYFDGLLDLSTNHILRRYLMKDYRLFIELYLNTLNRWEKIKLVPVRFLDNHDMERIYTILNNDIDLLKICMGLIYFTTSPVMLYYGTEIPMKQKRRFREYKSHADIETRRFMDWKSKKKLYKFIKTLNEIKSKIIHIKTKALKNWLGEKAAIMYEIYCKNDERYISIINPSPYHIDLNEELFDIQLGNLIKAVPPYSIKILTEK